jgi:hypothetical protein
MRIRDDGALEALADADGVGGRWGSLGVASSKGHGTLPPPTTTTRLHEAAQEQACGSSLGLKDSQQRQASATMMQRFIPLPSSSLRHSSSRRGSQQCRILFGAVHIWRLRSRTHGAPDYHSRQRHERTLSKLYARHLPLPQASVVSHTARAPD